jgi:integrase
MTQQDASHAKTWLTPDQVQQLRNACLSAEIPTYLQDHRAALLELLYDTGLRRAEAAALDVDHLDLEGETATLYLPGRLQKRLPNGQQREDATLALADRTRRALQRYLRDRWRDPDPDSGPLFPTRSSERITGRSVTRAVRRLAEVAQVEPRQVGGGTAAPEDVTAHTLRHSVAYRIIQEEGGRLEDVQLRLRHRSRQVTDRLYSHLIPR